MRRRILWVLLALFAADLAVGVWWFWRKKENRYDAAILNAARRYQVDPALVKAVVWRESAFQASAKGAAGEAGLMQIRNLAGQEWAQAERMAAFSIDLLYDPRTNTMAGAWYLSHLLKRYRQTDCPPAYALADYNAGRTHVLRWNKGEARTNSVQFLAQMDYPGTREYIRAVLDRHSHYRATWKPGR